MSSQSTATLPPKSSLSGFDQVSNILQQKLPFEVVSLVFEYLSVTYLESIGATLEQLISYSKHTTFDLMENQMIDLNGSYGIKHDGNVNPSNIDDFTI